MNFLFFLGKALIGLALSSVVAVFVSMFWVIILSYFVDYFKLNYKGDTYWVISSAFYIMWITWIVFFVYFTMLLK